MSFLNAILLGILQGLTEFLPVSSSGHLVLAQHFLNIKESGNILFEVFLHLGTLLAVIIFFRKRLWELILSLFGSKEYRIKEKACNDRMIILYLIIATAVTGLIYLIFGNPIESLYNKPLIVALMLIITGIIIFASDYAKKEKISVSKMGFPRSIFIGLIQGIAIIPGISRSGSTIAASLFSGIKREEAAEFSFLLSIPAILGANLVSWNIFSTLNFNQLLVYLAGFLASFLAGYLVIGFLLKLIAKSKLKVFAYWCWGVALISIIFLLL
ncbi:MAG: undecaprenyl-diphosphate phosphatase [Candidatus Cloacimonadaceae bacterium]|jgi:undecaprenyl-diphosphatase|nr:undecaprenyl-diphosphate phosphatase [Candidatus Cloacimonadota bacterium]MDY0111401.1 undecaprenyl-diphosphate phosphatase [Candidatus Syntrophosphaera sp.]